MKSSSYSFYLLFLLFCPIHLLHHYNHLKLSNVKTYKKISFVLQEKSTTSEELQNVKNKTDIRESTK